MRRVGRIAAGTLTAIACLGMMWLVIASRIFVWMAGLSQDFPSPWTTWWLYGHQPDPDKWTKLYLGASAVLASVPVVMIALILGLMVRPPRKLRPWLGGDLQKQEIGATDNHGHSQWLKMSEAVKLFSGPDPEYGGVVVGEAYRVDKDRAVTGVRFDPRDKTTWGRGGTAPLLIDPCHEGSTHSIICSGPGGFKSTSAVSTIMLWTGSSVILDPSCELGPMLDRALRAQSKKVHHIGIKSAGGLARSGINVLAWIVAGNPEAERHIKTVVSWIYDEDAAKNGAQTSDAFFTNMGRNLVTCLLAHLMYDEDAPEKTLGTLAQGLATPEREMVQVLEAIFVRSKSSLARSLAATLMQCRAPETFSGVYMNAINGCSWLMLDVYSDLVSDNTFDPAQLLSGNTTVFLNISLQTLENTPAIGRVLVGALLNTVYMADGDLNGRVLFLLDEAARLGRLRVLETARDAGRKYGITIQMLLQSVGQLNEIWGRDGSKSWFDAVSWVGYAGIRAAGAGKELSDQLGTHAVLAYSEGTNRGRQRPFGISFGSFSRGSNISIHEIKRALISAAELQQDLRSDEIIVVPQSGAPIRCGRAIYFRRPEMVAMVQQSRFARRPEYARSNG